jgi:hypothetical protein
MAFRFKLEHENGTPADPPTLHTAVPNWAPGDTIPLGPAKRLSAWCGFVPTTSASWCWSSRPTELLPPADD